MFNCQRFHVTDDSELLADRNIIEYNFLHAYYVQ